MGPFTKADHPPEFFQVGYYMTRFGVGREKAEAMMRQQTSETLMVNDVYRVSCSGPHQLYPGTWPGVYHLAIHRHDQQPIHNWKDLQWIKNMLVGSENEAIEIYPAESRLVDMGNTYHLWVFPPGFRLPYGWTERMVSGN